MLSVVNLVLPCIAWYSLTPSEQCQSDQCTEFGFEALEEWCKGDEVEDHVEEVEMRDGEQVQSVHYTMIALAFDPSLAYRLICILRFVLCHSSRVHSAVQSAS